MKNTLMGRKWDNLEVIGFNAESGKYECRCACGGSIWLSRFQISGRTNSCCDPCKRKRQYLRSIQINRKQLRGLSDAESKKIIRRFVRHVRLSHANDVQATSWATFVNELRGNPELMDDDPVWTVETSHAHATWQQFPQYTPPRCEL